MTASLPVAAVGVDWGTTHRRGYALAADGRCLAEHADADGMLAARGRFEPSLEALLQALGAAGPQVRVMMSGMVGSANGWVQAPYLSPEVPLRELGRHLLRVPGTARCVEIVPGIALKTATAVDVMRGEETQLLGAALLGHEDGWFLLPGTHSKWVHMAQGRVADFATFMTGELFDLLGRHGTLAAASGSGGEGRSAHHTEAFAQGLHNAAEGALSHALFGCRARVVTGELPPEQARDYLSGLLIGAEWHELRRRGAGRLPDTVTVIGAPQLAARHAEAAQAFGVRLHHLDPGEVYKTALAHLLTEPS
ncbi:MAG: 2-dehydro-3-deoxygalactonokinase [Betaproteobacteria bacterium]|jgi:2-dehydro-3-deoxygalactonokinase